MKKIKDLFWVVLALLAITGISSCSSGNDNDTPIEPKILTFGFYAEDNAEVLTKDYVLSTIPTDNNLTFTLPAFVDKSALIARFTTNEGNTITLSGVAQQSGVTANDFSTPQDYIASNGMTNLKYTVTIAKTSDMAWTKVAEYTDSTAYSGTSMKINPADNVPYLAFRIRTTDKAAEKMVVLKLADGTLTPVGPTGGFGNEVYSSYYNMDFDDKGTPYVLYGDATNTDISGTPCVQKWDGSTWSYVGDKNFAEAKISYCGMNISSDGTPVVAFTNGTTSTLGTKRTLISSIYSGSWNSTAFAEMSGKSVGCVNMTKSKSGIYLSAVNYGAKTDTPRFGYYLFKYVSGTWSTLLSDFTISAGSDNSFYAFDTTATDDGTVYILLGNNATNSYLMTLMKYDPEAQTCTEVGGAPISYTYNTHTRPSLAVAPDGTPFVVFKGDSDYPYYMYVDSETKQWTAITKIADEVADYTNICFTSNGVGYMSFINSDEHVVLYKYDVVTQ